MQSFFRRNIRFLFLLLLAFLTVIINQFPLLIEQYYSNGLYIYISRLERLLLGWIPFSIGDLLYAAVLIWIMVMLVKLIRSILKRKQQRIAWNRVGLKGMKLILWIYILFNWLWGFNYNRLGSAYQLSLTFDRYSNEELTQLTGILEKKMIQNMNDSALFEEVGKRNVLTEQCMKCYDSTSKSLPFLHYEFASVKPHTLYKAGNYLGFLGYLNPFTAEAQMNTTIPAILKPAVLCHEMGHQMGYASESEANFIAFLTCRNSKQAAFRYSVYYDMYGYAIGDLYYRDSVTAHQLLNALPDKIKHDRLTVRTFFRKYKNPFNPLIDWFYDKYLKLNSQPKGRESYNEVVGWMIAYAKRYGWERI